MDVPTPSLGVVFISLGCMSGSVVNILDVWGNLVAQAGKPGPKPTRLLAFSCAPPSLLEAPHPWPCPGPWGLRTELPGRSPWNSGHPGPRLCSPAEPTSRLDLQPWVQEWYPQTWASRLGRAAVCTVDSRAVRRPPGVSRARARSSGAGSSRSPKARYWGMGEGGGHTGTPPEGHSPARNLGMPKGDQAALGGSRTAWHAQQRPVQGLRVRPACHSCRYGGPHVKPPSKWSPCLSSP